METNQPIQPQTPAPTSKGTGFIGFMNSIPNKLMSLFKKRQQSVAHTVPETPVVGTEVMPNVANQPVQPQTSVQVDAPKPQLPDLKKIEPKKILAIGGVVLVLILLVSGILILTKPKPQIVENSPDPASPEPIATPVPTRYASDAGVLQIIDNIKIMDTNLTNTDLQEDTLRPRELDFNITFR